MVGSLYFTCGLGLTLLDRQIVNGLRDEDAESIYTGRTSFASEYDNDDSVQLYFKEHQRSGSQGSQSSFFSRRKSVKGKGGGQVRPETKVCIAPRTMCLVVNPLHVV